MASPDVSGHSLNTSTTSLSPSIANLNALSSPKSAAQNVHAQQRRMTAPAVPPPSSLNLPEPVYGHPAHLPSSPRRSPSPLRHDFSQGSQSDDDNDDHGDDDENEEANRTWVRGHSPASASVTQFATNLAQRVGSLMSPASGNRALPSDAELEAEALRERSRSRREAERILTREAEERRAMEQHVLAMMDSSPQSLPHPRGRSHTLPSSPSPAASAKEGGTSWWAAAKSRLTPTKEKEPLTPAQQIVQEAKARDKEKKNTKGKDKDWPASATSKYTDAAYLNLKIPAGGAAPRTSSPTSPTPNRTPVRLSPVPVTQPPINLSPISLQRGSSPGGSPAREQPPLYASFTPSGTLDVHGTLLMIAKRFEKLERWTVSHVRALEERMGDVERWLVDRENERVKEKGKGQEICNSDLNAIRDDVLELQSRLGELGREMARFATSPAVLSTTTAAHESPVFSSAPHTESSIVSARESSFNTISSTSSATTSIGAPVMGINVLSTPRRVPSMTARESTSPPLAKVGSSKAPPKGGTRLPYPTGDYASPSDLISPTHTPASSPPMTSRPTSKIVSGLPPISSPLNLPASLSPPACTISPTPSGLPAPSIQSARRGSVSPTPVPGGRKRYTVALGGPIVAPPDAEGEFEREAAMGTAYFSSTTESSDEDEDSNAETVGKKAAARAAAAARLNGGDESGAAQISSPGTRTRALSTHGGTGATGVLQSNQALPKHRFRSQSTDFRSDNAFGNAPQTNKFVDPLVLRRQSKSEKDNKPLVAPGKKVPVGQLVAFFDAERN